MKGERIRYQQTGDFHFITFSCYRRRAYLTTASGMELFEDALERVRRRYFFVVSGYVIMPEHVHLLVNEPARVLLSKAIQALKLSVSMRSRERPFWQAHYYDFNLHTHEKFVEKLRYIHRNPVRRGLVAKPEDWKWSSFRHYQTGARGTVEIESEFTAQQRGGQLPGWMRYRGQIFSSSPVPKSEGPGAPSSRFGKITGIGATRRFPANLFRPHIPEHESFRQFVRHLRATREFSKILKDRFESLGWVLEDHEEKEYLPHDVEIAKHKYMEIEIFDQER